MPDAALDRRMMSRCLRLASRARGLVSPNPMVGSVVTLGGRIIGEGFHRGHGLPHAEVNAIASVADHSLLRQATLYVNLEPCSHYGKTPPCADLLVAKGLARVVVGTLDPFPEVAGRGVAKLREAGVDVAVGVLEEECRRLNRRFLTFHEQGRPYVILKWAESSDGFLDRRRAEGDGQAPAKITCPACDILSHRWRSAEDAIMVGTATALLDNPRLDARHVAGRPPLRLFVDAEGRLPRGLHLFDGSAATLALTRHPGRLAGTAVEAVAFEGDGMIEATLAELRRRKAQSVIVEGGAATLRRFLDAGAWDEARRFVGPRPLGDGVAAPRIDTRPEIQRQVGQCRLEVYRNRTAQNRTPDGK